MTWEEEKKTRRLSEFMRLKKKRQEILDKGKLSMAERDQVRKYSHMMAMLADNLSAKDIFG